MTKNQEEYLRERMEFLAFAGAVDSAYHLSSDGIAVKKDIDKIIEYIDGLINRDV